MNSCAANCHPYKLKRGFIAHSNILLTHKQGAVIQETARLLQDHPEFESVFQCLSESSYWPCCYFSCMLHVLIVEVKTCLSIWMKITPRYLVHNCRIVRLRKQDRNFFFFHQQICTNSDQKCRRPSSRGRIYKDWHPRNEWFPFALAHTLLSMDHCVTKIIWLQRSCGSDLPLFST